MFQGLQWDGYSTSRLSGLGKRKIIADRQFHALSQSVKNFIIAELNNHDEKTMQFGVKISL
jgi:hypothetical protein